MWCNPLFLQRQTNAVEEKKPKEGGKFVAILLYTSTEALFQHLTDLAPKRNFLKSKATPRKHLSKGTVYTETLTP